MVDDRTPRDDGQPTAMPRDGVVRSVLRTLGALARGFDAAHGAGAGVPDPDGARPTDAVYRARRDHRP